MNGYNNTEKIELHTSQAIYDAFNSFIFSDDTKVLAKLVARTQLLQATVDVPGDIVECGVFKGSGLATWLKLRRILCPAAYKKVIGFDYFDTAHLVGSLSGIDQQRMRELFTERGFSHGRQARDVVGATLVNAGFDATEYELIGGDIAVTAPDFLARRPGFKVSLLYLDMDLADCTYDALAALWPRVSTGGLVVFDEYACHQWSESQGADRFCAEQGLVIRALDFPAPTACVVKA